MMYWGKGKKAKCPHFCHKHTPASGRFLKFWLSLKKKKRSFDGGHGGGHVVHGFFQSQYSETTEAGRSP